MVSRSRILLLDSLGLSFTTSLTPFREQIRFALFPFRSLLVGESLLISLPSGTKMFQFPECACLSAYTRMIALGDLGFNCRMRIAQAYRSLPRPSSQSKPSYSSSSLITLKLFTVRGDQIVYFSKLTYISIQKTNKICFCVANFYFTRSRL
jgi:hypothetical protein